MVFFRRSWVTAILNTAIAFREDGSCTFFPTQAHKEIEASKNDAVRLGSRLLCLWNKERFAIQWEKKKKKRALKCNVWLQIREDNSRWKEETHWVEDGTWWKKISFPTLWDSLLLEKVFPKLFVLSNTGQYRWHIISSTNLRHWSWLSS